MKISFSSTSFFLLFSSFVFSQEMGKFNALRYNDDYSFLKNDSTDSWYKSLKYTELSDDGAIYLSTGGEIRYRYLYADNEKWGDAPKDTDGYTLSRFLLHTDLHLGKRFRTFVQLQSSMEGSRITSIPVEDNPLEVQQAFIDYVPILNEKEDLTLRVGRQELLYGSGRVIALRDNPNHRQSFDAARLIYNNKEKKYKAEAFYSHFVGVRTGILNDGFNKNTKLWGAYFSKYNLLKNQSIDLYYLGSWKRNAVFNDAIGKELRHTVGTRIWKNTGNWNFDLEVFFQFGEIEHKIISAWTASIHTSYKFSQIKFQPTIGLKTEIISGDKKKGDNHIQTLNALYPNGAYFGLAALVGPSNIMDIHPSLRLNFSPKFNAEFDYDIFWRYRHADGIYLPNSMPIYSDGDSKERKIGNQFTGSLNYTPNSYFNIRGEFTHFKAGNYLKAVGSGMDIIFVGITTQLKF